MSDCKYCSTGCEYIGVSDYGDTRLFTGITGAYLRIFDEEYPGHTEMHHINYCPMCGRKLNETK